MDNIKLCVVKGCPKCRVLKEICKDSDYVDNNNFTVVTLDLTKEKHKKLPCIPPILYINEVPYCFSDAITYLEAQNDDIILKGIG